MRRHRLSAARINGATVGIVKGATPGTPNRLLFLPSPLALKAAELDGRFGAQTSGETYALKDGGGYLGFEFGATPTGVPAPTRTDRWRHPGPVGRPGASRTAASATPSRTP